MIAFLLTATALASLDPACEEIAAEGPPEGYTEQGQWDFLLNYFSLVTTFSPLHSAVPGEPGHASVGVELSVIPPPGLYGLMAPMGPTGPTGPKCKFGLWLLLYFRFFALAARHFT